MADPRARAVGEHLEPCRALPAFPRCEDGHRQLLSWGCCYPCDISAAFAEKSLFSFCLHFASLSCWVQGAGGEDAPPPWTGPTGRGERFPLEVQFFPITFVLLWFFLQNEL